MELKLSLASAMHLELISGKVNSPVTTVYIMLGEDCDSNCSFCAQARTHRNENMLSRVPWIEFEYTKILEALEQKKVARVCFQTLDYKDLMKDLAFILPKFKELKLQVSISLVPISKEEMLKLSEYVDSISFALDAANPEIFERVKGSGVGNRFDWNSYWNSLILAKSYFPEVNTHIIVGLGESDLDLICLFLKLKEKGISIALFSYTPLKGTIIREAPLIERYRTIQIAQYLIYHYPASIQNFCFEHDKLVKIEFLELNRIISSGFPFMTSGCKGCNRPYYNERAGKDLYNIPYLPNAAQIDYIQKNVNKYGVKLLETQPSPLF